MSGNAIEKVPPVLCALTQLQHLFMAQCHLESLPKEFGQLISLETLDLSANILSEVA